jgi:hypothetical protein
VSFNAALSSRISQSDRVDLLRSTQNHATDGFKISLGLVFKTKALFLAAIPTLLFEWPNYL